jgi:hypothetical protein
MVTGVVVDVPPHVPRRLQRLAFFLVRAAAALGRRPAHAAVRLLQLLSQLRHSRGGRMEGNVIHTER